MDPKTAVVQAVSVLRSQRDREISRLADMEANLAIEAMKKDGQIEELSRELVEVRQTVSAMEAVIANRDATIADLTARLESGTDQFSDPPTDPRVEELTLKLAEHEAALSAATADNEQLAAMVLALNGTIAQLQESLAAATDSASESDSEPPPPEPQPEVSPTPVVEEINQSRRLRRQQA